MAHHDMTGDGSPDLLVGRDDGWVEVYSYVIDEDPVLRYRQVRIDSIELYVHSTGIKWKGTRSEYRHKY